MKYSWRILSILTISFVLSTCVKDEQDGSTELYKCIITLNDELQIHRVDNYFSDSLDNSIEFKYNYDLVEVVKTWPKLNYQSKRSYFINNVGLADSCITIDYENDKLKRFMISKYDYNDKFKIKADMIIDNYNSGIITSTSYANLIYSINNGNTVSMWINGTCSEYFKFNEIENKIDIEGFLGDFNGKINMNLLESSYTDCPSSQHNEYDYTVNANGYVLERVEHYFTGYGSETNEVKKITQFEYKFQ
jgi:hypothetical protein